MALNSTNHNTGEILKMSWHVHPCTIEENVIKEIVPIMDIKVYNPYDEHICYDGKNRKQSLYEKFASIDENNLNEILNFYNNYGFLRKNPNQEDQPYIPRMESISEIQNEIRILRNCLTLKRAIDVQDYEIVKKCILNLEQIEKDSVYIINNWESGGRSHPGLGFSSASITLCLIVNKRISSTSPFMEFTGFFNTCNYLTGSWKSIDLVSALYTMFYIDITRGKSYKICENPNCSNWFDINNTEDEKHKYCSVACASQDRQRRYRIRIKNDKKESE